jgi:hypothetical protein
MNFLVPPQRRLSRFAFASPFVLSIVAVAGAQASGCNGALGGAPSGDGGAPEASLDAGSLQDTSSPAPVADGAVNSCAASGLLKGDYIDFCFQKAVLVAEHRVFDPTAGMPSSWSSITGKPDTDGGVAAHDVRDDVAYAASLATYAISAEVFGDTDIKDWVVTPDLTALAALLETELATLPASYDGEIYMRLRRIASGLRTLNLVPDGNKIDTIADAYGKAIYTTYFHPLEPTAAPDAGMDAGMDDGGGDAASPVDAGGDTGSDANVPPALLNDGILGVPAGAGGGIAYDVDQAASGALALADLASRSQTPDAGAEPVIWGHAAGSVMNHLYARARHPSGLYYADLVTSSDLDHDALGAVVTPSDALLAETQASVAASLTRMSAIVQATSFVPLASFPFGAQIASPLNGLNGVAPGGGAGLSLWDPTSNEATTAACAALPDAAACGGSGFFVRYLPSTSGLDNSAKTLRANALALVAIHRSLISPGTAASIDLAPLLALFESQLGPSFISIVSNQSSYFPAVAGDLSVATSRSFTAQANAYAIEALTEQWIGRHDCPSDFY